MIVLALLAPIRDSDLPILMSPSAYVPGATWIVSPALAAATAAAIVLKQLPLPGFTHSVAPAADCKFPAIATTPATIKSRNDHLLEFIATSLVCFISLGS